MDFNLCLWLNIVVVFGQVMVMVPGISRCPFPGCKIVGYQSVLCAHILAKHLEVKTVGCEVCGATFATPEKLRRHTKGPSHQKLLGNLGAPLSGPYTSSVHPLTGKDGTEIKIRFPDPAPNLNRVVFVQLIDQRGEHATKERGIVTSAPGVTVVSLVFPSFFRGEKKIVFNVKVYRGSDKQSLPVNHSPLTFAWYPHKKYDLVDVFMRMNLEEPTLQCKPAGELGLFPNLNKHLLV